MKLIYLFILLNLFNFQSFFQTFSANSAVKSSLFNQALFDNSDFHLFYICTWLPEHLWTVSSAAAPFRSLLGCPSAILQWTQTSVSNWLVEHDHCWWKMSLCLQTINQLEGSCQKVPQYLTSPSLLLSLFLMSMWAAGSPRFTSPGESQAGTPVFHESIHLHVKELVLHCCQIIKSIKMIIGPAFKNVWVKLFSVYLFSLSASDPIQCHISMIRPYFGLARLLG